MKALQSIEIHDRENGLAQMTFVYNVTDHFTKHTSITRENQSEPMPYWFIQAKAERCSKLTKKPVINYVELCAGVTFNEALSKMVRA